MCAGDKRQSGSNDQGRLSRALYKAIKGLEYRVSASPFLGDLRLLRGGTTSWQAGDFHSYSSYHRLDQ